MDKLTKAQLLPAQMLARLDDFAARIEAFGQELGLDLAQWQADHIALRINDNALTKLAHEAWAEFGETISTAQVNGRPIVVIKFAAPIKTRGWQIECLELPYPAPGKVYPQQDWEHMEFVIPSEEQTAEGYLADLTQNLSGFNPDTLPDGVKFKLSSPKGEGERLANPTVAFKKAGLCIKLHPHSLSDIIASEQQ